MIRGPNAHPLLFAEQRTLRCLLIPIVCRGYASRCPEAARINALRIRVLGAGRMGEYLCLPVDRPLQGSDAAHPASIQQTIKSMQDFDVEMQFIAKALYGHSRIA